jgi:phosphate-selective porin OprO/OprP
MLGRPALCGAWLLAGANLAQSQIGLPSIPQPVIPASAQESSREPAKSPLVAQELIQRPKGIGEPTTSAPLPLPASPSNDELRARVERLEKQNQELIDLLKSNQSKPVRAPEPAAPAASSQLLDKNDVQKMISDYLSEKESHAKAAQAKVEADKSYVVGKNLGLSGVWKSHQPWFETQDQAFRIHVGGRFQPDWVFGAGADDAVIRGKGGTGAFQEGMNFRRARLEVDGWIYECIDFFVEYDFANQFSTGSPFTANLATGAVGTSPNSDANTLGVPAPTDVWAGINYIPVIGGIRIGNLKPAIGLDHLTSSRYLDFLERSSGFDTYYNRANGFAPGFMIFNYTEDQRMSWQLTATRANNTLFGFNLGSGEWDYCARITGLPYYEAEGRRMVHIGMGAKYIDHLDQGFANLNTRWLLRQAGPNLQNTVAQVVAFGDSQAIVNPELFINLGPLSIQSEYVSSWVNGVTSFRSQVTGPTAVGVPSRTFHSQTAYIQAMYFLTGEHRPYGKSALHGSGAAPTRVVPYRNYFWVPGHGGNGNPFSAGAWQVGARYCYSDLNDGPINGGTLHEVTLGVNWFLNPNMKIQWNYDIGHRSIPTGTSDGYYYGFGMRMAFDF